MKNNGRKTKMETDPYYLQHEKLINQVWIDHYENLEKEDIEELEK